MLWKFQTGAGADAPVATYEVAGEQYVAILAGGNSFLQSVERRQSLGVQARRHAAAGASAARAGNHDARRRSPRWRTTISVKQVDRAWRPCLGIRVSGSRIGNISSRSQCASHTPYYASHAEVNLRLESLPDLKARPRHGGCVKRAVVGCFLAAVGSLHTQTPFVDPSPHLIRFVTVDKGVRLEVLDWRGTGRPIVLLGCYLTGHLYRRHRAEAHGLLPRLRHHPPWDWRVGPDRLRL